MENVIGILFLIIIVMIIGVILDWIALPYKIDKSNKLLKEILEELRNSK